MLPGTSASITSRSSSLAEPIACISSSSSSSPSRSTAAAIAFLPILAGTRSAICSNSLRPIAATSSYSLARTARRIEARALPVTTKPEPRQLRLGAGALDDLDHVAVVELGAQRHVPAVDLGADGVRAEIGVHREGEVDRRRALGQLEQRALGGEGEDAVLVDRQPGVLEQLLGVVAGIDDLDQVAQPADLAVGPVALLVGPVRGEAELVEPVHLAGCGSALRRASSSRRSARCAALR